jgi:hypothetical protein
MLRCRPGWKNRNGQKGPYESMTEGRITPQTEEVLDLFLSAFNEIFLVHIKGSQQIDIVFTSHINKDAMRKELACEAKKLLGWSQVAIEDAVVARSLGKITRH